MTLVVKHKSNAFTHVKNSSNSFKWPKITGSQRDNLKRPLVDCPFPSIENLVKLMDAASIQAILEKLEIARMYITKSRTKV